MKPSLLFTIIFFFAFVLNAQQISFPGAAGFGALSTGARGGEVYRVTNLNDSGPASFRDAVSKPNRTVVFDVGGVIQIKNRINVASHITIAGQTAPGSGIVIFGNAVSFSGQTNIIVRYIRFRGSIQMSKGTCTVIVDDARNIIFDHVSIEWGRWDNLHIKNSSNITLQYCIIGEAIDPQRFGALLEQPDSLTIHHCLWLDNQSRNPKAKAEMQFINNVVYNWGKTGFVGGHSSAIHHQDVTGNYFIAGPNSNTSFIGQFTQTDMVYQQGNFVDLNKDGKLNGTLVVDSDFILLGATILNKPTHNAVIPVINQIADDAFNIVLSQAGSSLHRDKIDARLIGYLKSLGKDGIIFHNEADAGGQDAICVTTTATTDTDHDGMSDLWEIKHKLNPNNASDRNQYINKDGYTNLEEYLNSLVTH